MIENTGKFLIGFLICLTSCKSVDSSTPLTNENYSVYSAYLNDFSFYKNTYPINSVIISDSTSMSPSDINPQTPWSWVLANTGDRCRFLKDTASCRKAHELGWNSLFENVKQSSHAKKQCLVLSKFKVKHRMQLLSKFREHSFNENKDGEQSTNYIFSMSKIAFNQNQTKALFFGNFMCGGLCGRGELVMLEKVGQTWVLIDTFRFWIS